MPLIVTIIFLTIYLLLVTTDAAKFPELKREIVTADLDIEQLKRQNANLAAALMDLKHKDDYIDSVVNATATDGGKGRG